MKRARSSFDYIPYREAMEMVKGLDISPERKTTAKIMVECKATVVIGNKRYITKDRLDQIVTAVTEQA